MDHLPADESIRDAASLSRQKFWSKASNRERRTGQERFCQTFSSSLKQGTFYHSRPSLLENRDISGRCIWSRLPAFHCRLLLPYSSYSRTDFSRGWCLIVSAVPPVLCTVLFHAGIFCAPRNTAKLHPPVSCLQQFHHNNSAVHLFSLSQRRDLHPRGSHKVDERDSYHSRKLLLVTSLLPRLNPSIVIRSAFRHGSSTEETRPIWRHNIQPFRPGLDNVNRAKRAVKVGELISPYHD